MEPDYSIPIDSFSRAKSALLQEDFDLFRKEAELTALTGPEGESLLHHARTRSQLAFLLDQNVKLRDDRTEPALFQWVRFHDMDLLQEVADRKLSMNYRDKEGHNLLFAATPAQITPLVEMGADINGRDNRGRYPWQWVFELKKHRKAIVKQILQYEPQHAFRFWKKGRRLLKAGRAAEAMESFMQALHINSGYADALNDMAVAMLASGDPEGALTNLKLANLARPDDAGIYCNFGLVFRTQRKDKYAIMAFSRALKYDPHYDKALINRGIMFLEAESYALAEKDLLLAAGLHPKQPLLHYNLACLYSLRDEKEAALRELTAAVKSGFRDRQTAGADPHLRNIADRPEFTALLRRMK